MSNLPVKQLKQNGQAFIPYSDTLIADSDNKVYKKTQSGDVVELVSSSDLSNKLDKDNGVAAGRIKIKATEVDSPGLMITTAGDNEDRWYVKLCQNQISAKQNYDYNEEVFDFFSGENQIVRKKDISNLAINLTKLDPNGSYQIKDLVAVINSLLDLLGAQEPIADID